MILVDEYAELVDDAPGAVRHADSIARRGRAVAVNLIAATQRPTQKAMGHGAVRSQMDVRICFRVRERKDVDLILGQGMLAAGWHAHTLDAPGKFLVSAAEHDTPRRARAYLVTDEVVASTASLHASLRPPLDEVSQRAIEERNPTEAPIAPDAGAGDPPRSPLDDEDEHGHADDDPEVICGPRCPWLVKIKSTLTRSIRRAQKYDFIGRNVVELVDLPQGRPGRPSRAMSEEQAGKALKAATGQPIGYVKAVKVSRSRYAAAHAATEAGEVACGTRPREQVPITEIGTDLSVVTCRTCCAELGTDDRLSEGRRLQALFVLAITLGLRPGELRKLSWDHVDLDKGVIHVWRSASRTGDVKTPNSKRSLVLPRRAVTALVAHRKRQAAERLAAGSAWHDDNLVFCHEDGHMYSKDELNWRFGKMTRRAGIGHWHAHEGRHTAVSIMSSNGVPIQEISDTVGHKSTHVTETVYRHVIVPAIRGGANVMDTVFGDDTEHKNGAADMAATP